ncbi:hypothetical protein H310_11080 [Aphanomyces invadans]|uniref:Potassium channel tetramerisation-type BTB domain-containing protein n=1 Tax=Aphanomyces invadans TaxID=157072 RepID=A0A024TPV6_9STRA|nr:hypothetical protein H310_11080 [Aphanomyces invadans]ETV95661.1 hypothetical protein H310_11080 [Aphanomyces invadans]|eukprot:XP_008875854.1 hypothetical protein H310_11080 [Aphanomyces invadans]
MVELNVGGTSFVTTTTTLMACGHSVFQGLLDGRSSGPIFVDWSPRAFAHVLKGLRTQSFHFVDKLADADRDEVLDALAYLKLDVTQCGYTAPNDDAKVGEPMVCPSKRRATERFEEMPAVGDPESGTRFSTTPPPDAIARKHKARARLEEAVRLEKQARKLRKKAHINYDDNLD